MSLQAIAHPDLIEIVNDDETGGVDGVITSPAGETEDFKLLSSDIHQAIDPGTGEIVTGRMVSAAVLTSELLTAGFDDIRGVVNSTSRPWLVTFDDVLGRSYTLKVAESYPDNSAGLTPLMLEAYDQ